MVLYLFGSDQTYQAHGSELFNYAPSTFDLYVVS